MTPQNQLKIWKLAHFIELPVSIVTYSTLGIGFQNGS